MGFADRIKSIIGSLSYEEFAKKIDVDVSTISNWISGKNLPKGDTLQRIHQKFNVDLNWLLSDEENPYIEREGREVFEARGIELQDGEFPWGKTRQHDIKGTPPLIITEFKPKEGQGTGPLQAAMEGLGEIFDSNDPILIPAIQANIRAFQLSARREHQNARQANQIKALQNKCDALKKRLDALEKYLKNPLPTPPGENIAERGT